ncbi:hypothetical protein C1645_837559 [Glomus cerebriforme]|uniref:Uncharacterized protein n=1 Tax=Glomus cerebriforme TaxID=658196 RepID=A0A397S8D0_9GLOM|nr:hypothetical protein C1645_837559 [Glomus cerebriforme]
MTIPINETCIEPRIDLRILYPNGTIEAAKVDYPIPESNFCIGSDGFYIFQIKRNFPDHLLVLYVNSTDIASASYYALLVTQTGKFVSNTYLAPVPVINGNLYPYGIITSYTNDEYGFLFTNYETETVIMWSYFNKLDDGKIIKISHGQYRHVQSPFEPYLVFPGIEGNFIFITTNSIVNDTKRVESNNPFEITFKISVSFFKPIINVIDGPFIIYQSTIPHLKVDGLICNSAPSNMISFCILRINSIKTNKKLKKYLLKISFLNSGSVFSIEKFSNIKFDDGVVKLQITYLHNGNFLLTQLKNATDIRENKIQGIILDYDGKFCTDWNLPPDLIVSDLYIIGDFGNGTIFLVSQEDDFSWKILSSNITELISNDLYDNPNINSSYPTIDSKIPLLTTKINITYNIPITISKNNISIYQNESGIPILRQSIPVNPSEIFSISNDSKTLNINVLESTFNQPNANYYIVIEDNAVKDRISNQPIVGVEKNFWRFKTGSINNDIFADDTFGLFSLTSEGTNYYNYLSKNDQSEFSSQLRIDLANAIPIDIKRLDNIQYYNFDKDKIILTLLIKSTTNANEINVYRVIKDLDILIRKKEITSISWFNTTNLIDSNFGFQQTRNYFIDPDFKFYFIGIIFGTMILGSFYYYAKKKHPEGKNIVILKFSLFLLDFVIDIAFILNNTIKVHELFIPSIIFCVIPIAINTIMSMIIILQEITKSKDFYKWFKNNTNIAAIFTILAGIDIEVLNVLSSQVAGIMLFNAPFSEKPQSYIFWGSLIGLFIKDIPQFIIKVSNSLKIIYTY